MLAVRRSAGFWWYRLLLVLLGGSLSAILGTLAVVYPVKIAGVVVPPLYMVLAVAALLAAPVFAFWTVRRLEVGWIFLGICATPLVPPTLAVKSLTIYPVELVLAVLAGAVAVRAVFHVREYVWPSFWVIWPLLALFTLAIVSEILIQVTWISQVPHKLNAQPVYYSELLGVALYAVPLLILVVTTACLTGREPWIVKQENVFLILSAVAAVIVCIEFKRIGADVYAFRYEEPTIFYMRLGALAQLMAAGAIFAYARALYAGHVRTRLAYGALVALCLAAIYFTLESARWLAVAVGLVVVTLIYSRRLFVLCCALSLPLIPVALWEVSKLQAVKGARDVNRLTIWADMLHIWWKRPLFGVGPGNVWPFDQVFSQLPLLLRNLSSTGLGVAHNGVLQVLTEVGPLGALCYIASAVVVFVAAWRLYRRSAVPARRADRILALACMGLLCGSLAGDFFSGGFFLPPAQLGGFNDLPSIFVNWIVFGCVMYRDQLWRTDHRVAGGFQHSPPDDRGDRYAVMSTR
jgi:O-antigen ligase